MPKVIENREDPRQPPSRPIVTRLLTQSNSVKLKSLSSEHEGTRYMTDARAAKYRDHGRPGPGKANLNLNIERCTGKAAMFSLHPPPSQSLKNFSELLS